MLSSGKDFPACPCLEHHIKVPSIDDMAHVYMQASISMMSTFTITAPHFGSENTEQSKHTYEGPRE